MSEDGTAAFGVAFLAAVFDASPDLAYVVNCGSARPQCSGPALRRLLGWDLRELLAMPDARYGALVHPEDSDRVLTAHAAAAGLADGEVVQLRCRVLHRDTAHRWLSCRLTPIARDEGGRVTQILGVARDVTDNVQAEEQLALAALHDSLTGLPNRALLTDRLGAALRRQSRTGEVVPLLYCDLDGFKHVNDTSGHHAGDGVLIGTAQRLQEAVRPQDTVARVGGDEFVVILESAARGTAHAVPHPSPTGAAGVAVDKAGAGRPDVLTETLAVADRLRAALAQPIHVASDGSEHVVTVSIGVTFARPGSEAEEALRDADSAMYRAKARGRNRHEVFDNSFRHEALERGHIEQALREALRAAPPPTRRAPNAQQARSGSTRPVPDAAPAARLSVMYQPVHDLNGPALVGVEALARLTDQHGRALEPPAFIAIAEQTGLIAPLGRIVLDVACLDLAAWHGLHPRWRQLGVAVNLSARQAGLVDLVSDVRAALARTGLTPGMLTLELTESVLLEAGRSTLTALTTLASDGVRLAIDDFGTGYASLRYLARLPVTSVKIDKSFTASLPADPTSATIVRTVAGLARDLGITCVVEGIETATQLAALPAGVHGQGYLLGRPLTATQMLELLARHAPPRDPAWPAHLNRPARVPPAPAARALAGQDHQVDLQAAGAPHRAADGPREPPPLEPADGHPGSAQNDGTRSNTGQDPEQHADPRENAADRRDAAADERDIALRQYEVDVDALLALAQERDAQAAVRDRTAGRRDLIADDRETRSSTRDPAAGQDRQSSAVDRFKGALDRDAGALDRADLTHPPVQP